MASKLGSCSSIWNSSSTGSLINTTNNINTTVNNPFVVNYGGSNSALTIDQDGNTVIEKLLLKDDKTGRKWQLRVSDGELIIEPLELEDKRDWKIKKILNNGL